MFSTILLFTITISLSYYLYKYYNKVKELELKLKITRDYANKKAEETLVRKAKAAKNTAHQKDVKAVIKAVPEATTASIEELVTPKKSRSRGRRKKSTNV